MVAPMLAVDREEGDSLKDIQTEAFYPPSGLTVRQLKELLSKLPDTNAEGESFEVWMETGEGTSSQVKSVWALNKSPDGCDVLMGLT